VFVLLQGSLQCEEGVGIDGRSLSNLMWKDSIAPGFYWWWIRRNIAGLGSLLLLLVFLLEFHHLATGA
jgi:hypothetical protein